MVPYGPLSPGGQGVPLPYLCIKLAKKRPDKFRPCVLVGGGDFLLNFDLFGADLGVSVIVLFPVVYGLVYIIVYIVTIVYGINHISK